MSDQSRRFYHWANSEWRNALQRRGLCIDCERPRAADGTTTRCRKCADDLNAKQRAARQAAKAPKWIQTEIDL